MSDRNIDSLRETILKLVKEYYVEEHAAGQTFTPGVSRIPYAGRVYNEDEMVALVDASLDFWLTHGRYSREFEHKLSHFLGVSYCYLVNSGSSANLLAFMALTSPMLGTRRILKGDEVITVAAGFPTTVAPIIQYGAIPVFVDVKVQTANIDTERLEDAVTEKTKAVMLAHTLGNPFNLHDVKNFCSKHRLWLIEDNCDSLGSRYMSQYTGTFGDIGTSSFYPPHHITTGEGGAVYTNDQTLARIMLSLRDWGRDCVCPPGHDNCCGHRFDGQFGELPCGYDHKYVYSHFGFNLKATDMQAAIGCAQLDKLSSFIAQRRANWLYLYQHLRDFRDTIFLPEAEDNSQPSWFGFLITMRPDSGLSRDKVVRMLESRGIQTRMLFAGNLTKHPCFDEMRVDGHGYRVVGNLEHTDLLMNNAFWLGVYPGLTREMLDYVIDSLSAVLGKGDK